MTRTEIETQVLRELHRLPQEKAEEALDFVLFLRSRAQAGEVRPPRQRPLGLLKGRAACRIGENFAVTDEELLRS